MSQGEKNIAQHEQTDTFERHQQHKARIALGLIWISSTIAMFIAVAFMLFLTKVDAKNMAFYIPVFAFALIMGVAIPLTAKITKHYSS